MQFKVLRAIEYNGKLYLPEGAAAPDRIGGVRSAGNGAKIPVDITGVIDLPADVAKQMTLGQVQQIRNQKTANQKSEIRNQKTAEKT